MYIDSFIRFLKKSPSSYHAVKNVKDLVKTKSNYSFNNIEKGKTYLFSKATKDGETLVAIDIGENIKDYARFNIVGSHADSPWFKIVNDDLSSEGLNLLKCMPYGGQIKSTWFDRPLTIAGRVLINKNNKKSHKLVYLKDKTFIIPNSCVHFARFIDEQELLINGSAIIGSKSKLIDILGNELGVKKDEIIDYELNLIAKQEPVLWGDNNEFISSQRLDDLASVYASLIGFVNSHNKNAINVLYISDNEEIGSDTSVGAESEFLDDCLDTVIKGLKLNKEKTFANSFMISADNAQGAHPYFSYLYNPNYKVYLNKGFAIKYSEKYSTTEKSALKFKEFCEKASIPYQEYRNRDDIPGGGTIGKIVQSHLNIESVDIGLAQLAMHSSFETMGSFDVDTAIKTFTSFYSFF